MVSEFGKQVLPLKREGPRERMSVRLAESNIMLVPVPRVFTARRREATVQSEVNMGSKVKTLLTLVFWEHLCLKKSIVLVWWC